jgi:hypothetical protein
MTIETNKATRSLYTDGDEGGYDYENVSLASADYSPTNAAGEAVVCRGFMILTATGAIKITTLAGTSVTIPTGLAVGVQHAIPFRKIFKVGTDATGIVAIT